MCVRTYIIYMSETWQQSGGYAMCSKAKHTALKGSRLSTLVLTKQRQQPEHHTNCLLVPWDLSGHVSSSGSYPGIMASAYRTAVTVPATLDLEKMVLRK